MKRRLLNPDPAEGSAAETAQTPVATPPATPAPPPATRIVVEGTKTEREIELERQLELERIARKAAETNAAYAGDEVYRLKQLQQPPAPTPKPPKIGVGWWPEEEA